MMPMLAKRSAARSSDARMPAKRASRIPSCRSSDAFIRRRLSHAPLVTTAQQSGPAIDDCERDRAGCVGQTGTVPA